MNEQLATRIALLDERLIGTYRNDNDFFDRLRRVQKDCGILHEDRPICPFLRPFFMPRSLYDRITVAAETLHGAFMAMTDAALADPVVMEELGLTPREEMLARIDPKYSGLCLSSRLDTFVDGGEFKFLEYNAETPAGVGDQLALETLFNEIPEVREFLEANPHYRPQPFRILREALVAAYRETGGREEKPTIAIVDWSDVPTYAEFEILRDYWISEGFNAIIANPYEFEYDGRHLFAQGIRVDIFYKRVLIHEFLQTFDDSHPLVRAYADGNICMANNFRVKIPHKKTSLAVLSDERFGHLFNDAQKAAIHAHIPWTRRVRESKTKFAGREVDLMTLLRDHRERFLLKPHDDYGGHGIVIGWEVSQSHWEGALNQAVVSDGEHCFVAQERASVEKTTIPAFGESIAENATLNVDFDPYLFSGRVEGGMVRLASSSLVNISQGGGETALVILDD